VPLRDEVRGRDRRHVRVRPEQPQPQRREQNQEQNGKDGSLAARHDGGGQKGRGSAGGESWRWWPVRGRPCRDQGARHPGEDIAACAPRPATGKVTPVGFPPGFATVAPSAAWRSRTTTPSSSRTN